MLKEKRIVLTLIYISLTFEKIYFLLSLYKDNAYPADELMPLSCKGRYRGSEPNRGDIDSTLGK